MKNYMKTIYIIQSDDIPRRVFISKDSKVKKKYKWYILKIADKHNVVINPHWYNVMDHKLHNSHLSEEEFKKIDKKWDKVLKQHSFAFFAANVLKLEEIKNIKIIFA